MLKYKKLSGRNDQQLSGYKASLNTGCTFIAKSATMWLLMEYILYMYPYLHVAREIEIIT